MRPPRLAEANFAYLLVGLLFMMVLMPSLRIFLGSRYAAPVVRETLMAGFSLMPLIGVWSLQANRRVFHAGLVLAALQLASGMAGWALHEADLLAITAVIGIVFSILSCYMALRYVFDGRPANANTLMGAISVYLLLGLTWATLYVLLDYLWPDQAFTGIVYRDDLFQFDSYLYFSFVTLTTAGYGDIAPVNPLIRTLAYLEMITGQFYMAVLVAGLVTMFMTQRARR